MAWRSIFRNTISDLWGIARFHALYYWYCVIRRRPDLLMPIIERERKEMGWWVQRAQELAPEIWAKLAERRKGAVRG